MNYEAAAAYAERHSLEALLVQRDGETIFERYADGFAATKPHALYSGTKSFWGLLAVAAQEDGLLALDETVGASFAQWNVGMRKHVTLRNLLQLTSGVGFGGLGNAVPSYERALATELEHEPGTTFTYGGIPLQVFGAVLAKKLASLELTPRAYLERRVLSPIGMHVDKWRVLRDGTEPLPTGAFVAASEWAKFGRLAIDDGAWDAKALVAATSLAECFRPSVVNEHYGLGWWLADVPNGGRVTYASGSGGQAMYLLREERAVVVKFGRSSSYRHETFLRKLSA